MSRIVSPESKSAQAFSPLFVHKTMVLYRRIQNTPYQSRQPVNLHPIQSGTRVLMRPSPKVNTMNPELMCKLFFSGERLRFDLDF